MQGAMQGPMLSAAGKEQILVAVVKFIISVLTVVIMSQFADQMNDFMLSPEEREQKSEGNDTLKDLALPDTTSFTTHELLVASGLTKPTVGFEDIGGHFKIKEELRLHVVIPMRHHELFYSDARLQPPGGLLFTGPPGTGKTMLARALASECGVPLLVVKTDLVEQKYFGESEKIVRGIFSFATKIAPCVVFIDEIDGMMRNRSEFEQSHTYSIKTQLLQEIDRVENEKKPIVLIAATNTPNSLDKALYRRLPRHYRIGKPDADARRDIFRKSCLGEPQTTQLRKNEDWLVENTSGFSGADMKNLFAIARALRNETFTRILSSNATDVTTDLTTPLMTPQMSPGPITKTHLETAISRIHRDQ